MIPAFVWYLQTVLNIAPTVQENKSCYSKHPRANFVIQTFVRIEPMQEQNFQLKNTEYFEFVWKLHWILLYLNKIKKVKNILHQKQYHLLLSKVQLRYHLICTFVISDPDTTDRMGTQTNILHFHIVCYLEFLLFPLEKIQHLAT